MPSETEADGGTAGGGRMSSFSAAFEGSAGGLDIGEIIPGGLSILGGELSGIVIDVLGD